MLNCEKLYEFTGCKELVPILNINSDDLLNKAKELIFLIIALNNLAHYELTEENCRILDSIYGKLCKFSNLKVHYLCVSIKEILRAQNKNGYPKISMNAYSISISYAMSKLAELIEDPAEYFEMLGKGEFVIKNVACRFGIFGGLVLKANPNFQKFILDSTREVSLARQCGERFSN
jgi:hypothetical protein